MGVDLQKADPSYIDLEAGIGRVILSLPGPRDDAAYPSYQCIIRTKQSVNTEDSIVSIQIKGDKNQSELIPLTESDNDKPLKTKTISKYFLYGICLLGEVN